MAEASLSEPATSRRRLLVRGLVQGVGFRPFVFRLAERFGLAGFVQNGPDGVTIEVEGAALDQFQLALSNDLPPLARIDSVLVAELAPSEAHYEHSAEAAFSIRETTGGQVVSAAIPADKGLCESCLQELFGPTNRRYLHPFIACTNCGPRYSMARALPYDRSNTAMNEFPLCRDCDEEYGDPGSRRFHAEPVCCHHCGPQLSHSLEQVAAVIEQGGIVALKGIGGFHLACDARNAKAVQMLRQCKRRDARPFAVMALNVQSARTLAHIDEAAQQVLESQDRPVAVLPGKGELPECISPGLNTLGVMLPYTGLHYLLLHTLLDKPDGLGWLEQEAWPVLVMTSANSSGDPLVVGNVAAERELGEIADLIVTHDRDITRRIDDSVVRMTDRGPLWIRRARGAVPNAIPLAESGPTVLATGAHLKNTITLARGELAWLSPHIGDLETPAALEFQSESCESVLGHFNETPDAIACDWHRDYAATRLAEQLAGRFDVPLIRVQHHHAHIAAVLAEHGHKGPALGIALDGHGLGERNESWGGELLRLESDQFERLGHFAPLLAPGGDAAAREPWRMAAAALFQMGRADEIESRFQFEPLAGPLRDLLQSGTVGETTAAGRLFDCAAALLNVCDRAAFEAEPPMRLESLVKEPLASPNGYQLENGVLNFLPLLERLADCDDPAVGAEWLHGTLITALTEWGIRAADETGIDTIALAGGCFLNRFLAEQLPNKFESAGLKVLTAQRIPANDAGISLGQAWVARQRLQQRPSLEVL